jgi:hypothetical protein
MKWRDCSLSAGRGCSLARALTYTNRVAVYLSDTDAVKLRALAKQRQMPPGSLVRQMVHENLPSYEADTEIESVKQTTFLKGGRRAKAS